MKTWKNRLLFLITNFMLFLWIILVHGISLDSIIICCSTFVMLHLSIKDAVTYIIPPKCNVLIAVMGILRLFISQDKMHMALPSSERLILPVLGAVLLPGFFLFINVILKGRGMGGGDIKLMAASGLLVGFINGVIALLFASVISLVVRQVLRSRHSKVLAFGPYLSTGIFLSMLYGDRMSTWYFHLLNLS